MNSQLDYAIILETYDELESQRKTAEALGISRRQVRKALNWRGNVPDLDGYDTVKVRTEHGEVVGTQHKPSSEEPDTNKNIEDLKNSYSVTKITSHYGEGGHREGRIQDEYVMYSPEREAEWQYFEALKGAFTSDKILALGDSAVADIYKYNTVHDGFHNSNECMATFITTDEHYGLKAHGDIVGEEWDLQKSIDKYRFAFERLALRTHKSQPATSCVQIHLGDKFHANDHMGVTPRGKNPLLQDQPIENVAEAVIELEMWKAEFLSSLYGHVENVGVKGNHDKDPMFWLFLGLQQAYRDNPKIDWSFQKKGYGVLEFGTNAIGYDHGYTMKYEELSQTFSKVFGVEKGRTLNHEIHTGHVHHDRKMDTRSGWTIYAHRAPCGITEYEHEKGYSSIKTLRSMIYHTEEGKIHELDQNM